MGSKRNKKSKQELDLNLEKMYVKSKKEKDDLLIPELHNNSDNYNNENNGIVRNKKRKKKSSATDEIDDIPKKIKNEIVLNELENNVAAGETKKVSKNKKKRSQKQEINRFDDNHLNSDENLDIKNDQVIETNMKDTENSNKIKFENRDGSDKKKEEITWPDQDVTELLQRMEQNIPEKDTLAYSTRVEKLEWENITFNNYSIEDCKKTWMLVQKQIRKFRLLSEVLTDAKEWISKPRTNHRGSRNRRHPDMPRRPLSAYLLFYIKKKDKVVSENPGLEATELSKLMGQIYRNLSAEKREKYEKLAAISRDDYNAKLKIFFDTHPDYIPPTKSNHKSEEKPNKIEKPPKKSQTPFGLYYSAELKKVNEDIDKLVFREKCKQQWKHMSDKKKLVWITLAEQNEVKYEEELKNYIEKHPEYEPNRTTKSLLTKEEKSLKERVAGKPIKPPNSAYGLYSKNMLKSSEIKTIPPKDRMNYIANQWKNCSEEEKNAYRDTTMHMMEKYKLEYASYLESLPEDKRELEIATSKKIRSVPTVKKPTSTPKKRVVVRKKVTNNKVIEKSEKLIDKTKFEEPPPPPVSACKYFASVYKGNDDPYQAWKALSAEEKQSYKKELVQKKQAYIVEFEKFLNSLSKEELEAFSNSRQAKSDDESSDCSSQSEEDDDEDDEEGHCSDSD